MPEITYDVKDKEIFSFDVLWLGWQSDSIAFVYEKPTGIRYITMTNHGSRYVATRKELEDKIEEYKKATEDTEKALVMVLKGNY